MTLAPSRIGRRTSARHLPSRRLAGERGGNRVVDVTMPDDGLCASHPGMLDPRAGAGQTPRSAPDATGPTRICEVSELLGAQAESCRTSVDCPGCGPGWCATDVWGSSAVCADTDPFFLRFVEGALPRERATIQVVCAIFSADPAPLSVVARRHEGAESGASC